MMSDALTAIESRDADGARQLYDSATGPGGYLRGRRTLETQLHETRGTSHSP